MRGLCPNPGPSFYLWVSTFSFHLSGGGRVISGHCCLGDAWLRTETVLLLSPGVVMCVIESSVSHLVYLLRMNEHLISFVPLTQAGRWCRALGLMFSSPNIVFAAGLPRESGLHNCSEEQILSSHTWKSPEQMSWPSIFVVFSTWKWHIAVISLG